MGAGDMARAAAWVASIGLVARHTAGAWQLARTLAWLRHGNPMAGGPIDGHQISEVHVVVPVLREQQHVAAALAWWRQILPAFPGMSLTIVSTAREEHERDLLALEVCRGKRLTGCEFPQLTSRELTDLTQIRADAGGHLAPEAAVEILARTPLTREVVDQLLADDEHALIRHLSYPGIGRKAAQINYAARSLPKGGYLAVYDVDSRPDVELLTATYALIASRQDGPPPVVQQHALHTVPQTPGRSVAQAFVRGSATLQSVWTLRREIPYARRYQKAAGRAGWVARVRAGLSQPVGHGLFLRHDVVADLGGLPEITVLDDVPTGVPLTLRGIPTVSVSQVTAVPAPETVAEIVAQGRRWFCSYLDYPTVLRSAARTGTGSARRRNLIVGIATYRGAAWLAASPLTAVTIVAALVPRSGSNLRATACAGVLLATVVPVVMVSGVTQGRISVRETGRDSAGLLAAYLLRSVGPWWAVADAVRGRHPTSWQLPAPKAHRRGAAS